MGLDPVQQSALRVAGPAVTAHAPGRPIMIGSHALEANKAVHSVREKFRGHIPELDALRGIGIAVVVLHHTFPEALSKTLAHLLTFGWAFMDSFFVLSGFLITGILLDSKDKPDFFKNFFAKRALRILPIYYVVITALTLAVYITGDFMPEWGSPGWFFVYLGNIPTAIISEFPSFAGYGFAHLWSLQIEEQFYLLFPLLVRFVPLPVLTRLLVGMVLLSPTLRIALYWIAPDNWLAPFVFLPCRWDGLALGALIAIRYRSGPWLIRKSPLLAWTFFWVAMTALLGWYDAYGSGVPIRTVGILLAAIASAHLIVWLIECRGSVLSAVFRVEPLQYLGRISYGVYLFHWPLLSALAHLNPTLFGLEGVPRLLVVGPLSLALAALSWHFFESPLLRLRNRIPSLARQV